MSTPRDICILVVENDTAFRRVVVTMLERSGFNVLAASDFAEAAAVIEGARQIDLLLADAGLAPQAPDRPSIADFAKLRRPSLRIVYMSSSYDSQQVVGLVEGASFLAKPFRSKRLIQSVETALA